MQAMTLSAQVSSTDAPAQNQPRGYNGADLFLIFLFLVVGSIGLSEMYSYWIDRDLYEATGSSLEVIGSWLAIASLTAGFIILLALALRLETLLRLKKQKLVIQSLWVCFVLLGVPLLIMSLLATWYLFSENFFSLLFGIMVFSAPITSFVGGFFIARLALLFTMTRESTSVGTPAQENLHSLVLLGVASVIAIGWYFLAY